MKNVDHLDVVLSGGLLSNYLCAALLSKAGKRVLLIDDNQLNNSNQDPNHFDTDFSLFTGISLQSTFGKSLEDLGLANLMEWFQPLEAITQMVAPNYRLAFWSDYENAQYDLKRELKNNSNVLMAMESLYRFCKEFPSFLDSSSKNFSKLSEEIDFLIKAKNKDEFSILKNWGSALVGATSFCAPSNLNLEQWIKGMTLLFHGTHILKGGDQTLKDVFAKIITENGGIIKTETQIDSLISSGNDITGVLLSSFEGAIMADSIVLSERHKKLYLSLSEKIRQPSTMRVLSKVEPQLWKYTVSLKVNSDVIPIGVTTNMVYVASFQEPLQEENYLRILTLPPEHESSSDKNSIPGTTILITALVPYVPSTLELPYLRKLGGKMLRYLSELIPFLEDNIISIYPDIRKSEDEVARCYPFHSLESIPQNLIYYYVRGGKGQQDFDGTGWNTAHKNLYFSGRSSWPSLGVYGEFLAARKIYEDIARPKMN